MTTCIPCQTAATAEALGTTPALHRTYQRALDLAARDIAQLRIEKAQRDPLLAHALERCRELEDICERLNTRLATQGRR